MIHNLIVLMDIYREALPNLAVADVQMAYDISRHILSVGSCTLLKFPVLLVCSSVACLFLCFLFVPMLLVCSYVACLFQCCLFVPMLLVCSYVACVCSYVACVCFDVSYLFLC